ncbi:MAG: SCP2 sterol-binding domain-containing protein [Anaerolineales bacterium]|nr:SCP2 sterol-binding domain-containing protein [Anaerolineales bacterium]
MSYTKSFPIKFQPTADPKAAVSYSNVRFTVLTSRLLRLEYSPTAEFEDRPSQAFWYRRQPVPDYKVMTENGRFTLNTEYLQLNYQSNTLGFTAESLTITLKANNTIWHFGQDNSSNLLGTARTLDNIDGALGLETGLISRSGWAVYDDTPHLVFNADGWLEPRNAPTGYIDLYFFGFGQDYKACLHDFARVAGPAPLLPRWALGNWWSRYWAYSDVELLDLMDDFAAHEVPLSVCIVDMDWHITRTGNACSGWTGYTWNRELFPDPPAFIAELHKRGLKTALNLHPAEGIHAHEVDYPALAARVGIDPASQTQIPFDIANTYFTEAYFELLHHPKEAEGIDFWWMDWQQGTLSGLPGLDPLYWLNHLHFYDLGRDGHKRPFIFSRWGGLGNHRYPIGFSGDTHVTWESLQFQPYFTAAAANVNYGWWSHDIGGHMGGIEEAELFTRWVQYGVFSPILRLHCTNNMFHERRPWGWDAETELLTSDAMRLRHALIPYLYTMAWRNHNAHLPLITPMYYEHPADEQAYHCPDQYMFGSELLAAPFITPIDPDTQLAHQAVWLPPGDWFGFFDGLHFIGDGWQPLYGRIDEIPLFAKAGAIVPMAAAVMGTDNPNAIDIHLFPGANNQFDLYEDDGLDKHSLIPISQTWSTEFWQVEIGMVQGETDHLPLARDYVLLFRGVDVDTAVSTKINGKSQDLPFEYDPVVETLRLTAAHIAPDDHVSIILRTRAGELSAHNETKLSLCRKLVNAFRMDSWVKQTLYLQLPEILVDSTLLDNYELTLTSNQMRALVEIITGAGCYQRDLRRSQGQEILLWSNHQTDAVTSRLAGVDVNGRSRTLTGPLPKFAALTLDKNALTMHVGIYPVQGHISIDSWFNSLPDRLRDGDIGDLDAVIQFDVLGENGRSAYVSREHGRLTLTAGVHKQPNAGMAASAEDWLALINGTETPENLFVQGKLTISGDFELLISLAAAFDITPPGKFQPNRWRLTLNYNDVLDLRFGF